MIIDGETYACEPCIRGHRTSNCKHNDRPLQIISKKGRPVSQCLHCRSLRTSRSAHVKCNCGKRTDRSERQGGFSAGGKVCDCSNGGRCICALKKDQSAQTTAAEGGDALKSSLQDINDILLGPQHYTNAFSNSTGFGDFGYFDDKGIADSVRSNASVQVHTKQFANTIGDATQAENFTAPELGENETLANPDLAALVLNSSSDPPTFEQRCPPVSQTGLSDIRNVGNDGLGLSDNSVAIAQQYSNTDPSFTNWPSNEFDALGDSYSDQTLPRSDYAWFIQPSLISTDTSNVGEGFAMRESGRYDPELRLSTITFNDTFNRNTNPAGERLG